MPLSSWPSRQIDKTFRFKKPTERLLRWVTLAGLLVSPAAFGQFPPSEQEPIRSGPELFARYLEFRQGVWMLNPPMRADPEKQREELAGKEGDAMARLWDWWLNQFGWFMSHGGGSDTLSEKLQSRIWAKKDQRELMIWEHPGEGVLYATLLGNETSPTSDIARLNAPDWEMKENESVERFHSREIGARRVAWVFRSPYAPEPAPPMMQPMMMSMAAVGAEFRVKDHDLQKYLDYMSVQVEELLTNYGSIMAFWLDGIAVPLHPLGRENFDPGTDGDVFRCQELYDFIHRLQPECLVSYKQGYLGTEDFFAPEHTAYNRFGEKFTPKRPGEVCTTMTPGSWGYAKNLEGKHLREEQVWQRIQDAANHDCNLLLNTGPRGDGSLVKAEADVIRAVGKKLAGQGWPVPSTE